MEIPGILSALPELLALIPTLIYVTEMVFYAFLVYFFGSISARGLKMHLSFVKRFPAAVVSGLLCLVAGISLSGFVPIPSNGFFGLLHIDLMIAAFFVSLLLLVALRLVTHDRKSHKPGEVIKRLKKKVEVLEGKLKKKEGHISGENAKKIARKSASGYEVKSARLEGSNWNVRLKRGGNECRMVIDAWDGEIKERKMKGSALRLLLGDARKVAGILIIIAIISVSLVFFKGLPSAGESFSSLFGMDMNELSGLAESMKGTPLGITDLPEGCMNPVLFASYYSQFGDREFLREHSYDDGETRRTVEENSGDAVAGMIRIDHEGKDVIVAFTDKERICYLTDGVFCSCF